MLGLGEMSIHELQNLGGIDLGDHQGIGAGANAGLQIRLEVRRGEAVQTDEPLDRLTILRLEEGADPRASLGFARRGYGVLQIQNHGVRPETRRFGQLFLFTPRDEQEAPAKVGRRLWRIHAGKLRSRSWLNVPRAISEAGPVSVRPQVSVTLTVSSPPGLWIVTRPAVRPFFTLAAATAHELVPD